MKNTNFQILTVLIFSVIISVSLSLNAAELKVGAGQVDITPSRPVLLTGQHHTRVSKKTATPLTAQILALEGLHNGKTSRLITISLDIIGIRLPLDKAIRTSIQKAVPDIETNDIMLNATHTHTSSEMIEGRFFVPEGTEYMKPTEFVEVAAEKIGIAVAEIWKNRKPSKFSYGLSYAAVAANRRAVYANGEGIMYGDTKRSDFRYIEGLEDHDIGTIFFWDENDRLTAMIINIACPSQEVEGLYEIHADFWHPVREQLRAKYGNHVTILSWVGAAGDFSPHTMYRKEAEERMRSLRKISRLDEISRRITNAVNDCYEIVKNDKQNDIVFRHEYELIPLPYHKVTQKEYNDIVNESKAIEARLAKEPQLKTSYDWTQQMVGRFESQQKGEFTIFETPVHIIRIGDIAVMSNPFELFNAYGIQMKSRCHAVQTFIIQLTDAPPPPQVSAGYLPTADAYRHGGYSAIVKSIHVGPEGGQKLVEESLKWANALFKE